MMRIFSCYVGKEEKNYHYDVKDLVTSSYTLLFCTHPKSTMCLSVTFGLLREMSYRLHSCSPLSVLMWCGAEPAACTCPLSTRRNKSLEQEKKKKFGKILTEGYLVAAVMNPAVPKVGGASGNEYVQLLLTREIKGLHLKLSASHIETKSRNCFFAGWLVKLHKSLAQKIVEVRTAGPKMRPLYSHWIEAWVGNKGATIF